MALLSLSNDQFVANAMEGTHVERVSHRVSVKAVGRRGHFPEGGYSSDKTLIPP